MQTLQLDKKISRIEPQEVNSSKKLSSLTWKDIQGLSWIFEENW